MGLDLKIVMSELKRSFADIAVNIHYEIKDNTLIFSSEEFGLKDAEICLISFLGFVDLRGCVMLKFCFGKIDDNPYTLRLINELNREEQLAKFFINKSSQLVLLYVDYPESNEIVPKFVTSRINDLIRMASHEKNPVLSELIKNWINK